MFSQRFYGDKGYYPNRYFPKLGGAAIVSVPGFQHLVTLRGTAASLRDVTGDASRLVTVRGSAATTNVSDGKGST